MDVTVQISGLRGSGRTTVATFMVNKLRELGAVCTTMRDSDGNEIFSVKADQGFLSPASSQVCEVSALPSRPPLDQLRNPSPNLAKHSDKPKVSTALSRAEAIIYGEREQTYGDPSKNLRTIADYWSTHLNASYGKNIRLTTDDVCVMMILLKQARQANTPGHQDSIDDTIGYAALQDRVNSSKKLEAESPVARAFKNHEY